MPGTVQQFITYAERWVGITPYVYGGLSLITGTDCSGYCMLCAEAQGVSIPRTTQAMWAELPPVPFPPAPGDLILFNVPSDGPPQPQHVGIYLGPNLMVSAPHTGLKVMYSTIPNEASISIMGFCRIPFATAPVPVPSLPTEEDHMGLAWSPDGTRIAAVGADASNQGDLLVFNVSGYAAVPGTVVDMTDAIQQANPGQRYTVQP